ncbi:DnaJ domain-containing protein [Verrucomicrobia bacterium]|nr:DnaJ domain-containing protein [Verrucomicrobiota bacterium]MDA7657565.1 DnaJ domain-containing protein [Verrucomicrobiota bacterium]
MKKEGDSLEDYYSILGVSLEATALEIRLGYRQLAKRYHPDVSASNLEQEERFRKITEAYNVLGNPGLRKKYDVDWAAAKSFSWVEFENVSEQSLKAEAVPNHRKSRQEWLDDDDEGQRGDPVQRTDVFGNAFDGSHNRSAGDSKVGRDGPDVRCGDLETELLVTLNEVLRGAVRVINVRRKGTSESPRQYTIQVPQGVGSGHVIRLEGKGRTSLSRGTTGDLFVSIRYASHPDFQICGYDLHHRIVLRPWQFALGDVVTVPTIDGELQTKVLAGSLPGQNLKIRNQGLPKGVEERGDLFVELQIEFPQRLSVEAKQAWEAVRRTDDDAH